MCARRTYKNRTHVRARTGTTGIATRRSRAFRRAPPRGRAHARASPSNIGAVRREVPPSYTRVGARKVRARVRRSLAFRSCYYASACAPRCMKRFPDLLFQSLLQPSSRPASSSSPSPSRPFLLLPFPSPGRVFPPPRGRRTGERERKKETAKVWCRRIHEQTERERERGEGEGEDGLLTRCPFSIKCNDSSSPMKICIIARRLQSSGHEIASRRVLRRAFRAREFEDSISKRVEHILRSRVSPSSILDFPRDLLLTSFAGYLAGFYLSPRRSVGPSRSTF